MSSSARVVAGALLAGALGVLILAPRDPAPAPQWELALRRPVPNKYEDLSFPTARDGWVVSAGGEVLHTDDGGQSWSVQATRLGHLRSLTMVDPHRGFVGTLNGTLYRTVDGGTSWDDVTSALPVTPGGFCGMASLGQDVHLVGRFVGGVTDYYSSRDSGETWAHQDLSPLAQGLVDVVFVDPSVGFIGGMAPSEVPSTGPPLILKTEDGGATWRVVFEPDLGRGFAWKIFPASATTLYAALQTEDGTLRVANSSDAGDHWHIQILAEDRRPAPALQAVGFLDEQHGWAGGYFRGMFVTSDGGASWAREASPDVAINRYVRAGPGLVTASRRGMLRLRPSR